MILVTERIIIKEASSALAHSVSEYYISTKEQNQAFEPIREEDFYTERYWLEKFKLYESKSFEERGVRYLLFLNSEPDKLVGYVNFDNIIRGVFQACTLGYAMAPPFQGKGYMQEALEELIKYVFQTYNLHRIQANYVVGNEKSAKVLDKLGFVKEGLAKDYLLIDGKWKDHILTSLINKNWRS